MPRFTDASVSLGLGLPAYLGGVAVGEDVIVIHASEVPTQGTSGSGIWVQATD